MVRNSIKRFAFTMIELIFAIVIIGIAVLSLPMMTQVTSRGIESNILQEAIFAASAELMGAASGYWDANSMADNALSQFSRVIDIGSTCVNNTASDRHRLRPGHIVQPLHRRCVDGNITAVPPLNVSSNTFFNLDNAELGEQNIFIDDTANASGYKANYTSIVTVTPSAADANIKLIEITVRDSEPKDIVVLRMQSANIGEIDYYRRRF
ncbi:type II secretion system protein [Candidatus Sulfurimonas marisnigri]|uniref:Type II secretion system protein n=1 Tax=Candidatus Sulfurimonas marisnigri TaxID=2740405 RepID=A0A7S7M2G6_9BACT|nr:type II secretion system protein [Candidatus Sulfurimonas marisnigri]QOY55009.1 type II secretion system protein [Candidatus Sulfurimonas marisnigri]